MSEPAPRRRKLLLATLALVAVAVSACTSSSGGLTPVPAGAPTGSGSAAGSTSAPASPTTPPSPDLAKYYSQKLSWSACGGSFECAKLTVPLDYSQPGKDDIQIAVIRLKASGHRLGSLVINPGGPGASGVDYARAARSQFTAPLRQTFDIVGLRSARCRRELTHSLPLRFSARRLLRGRPDARHGG